MPIRRCLPLAAALLAVLAAGCRQDMHNQPKYIPLRSSSFFGDHRSARLQPEYTVARDQLNADVYLLTGKVGIKEGTAFPFPVTEQVMQRGRERFNIYCAPCHSRVGDGAGMIVERGYKRAADFTEDRLMRAPVGHFYDVITNGWGAMPDYKAQIPVEDRWAIAAYIRALQFARTASINDVPAGMRGNIADKMPEGEEAKPKPATSSPGGSE
jgi:hypothetical protein